MLLYSVEGQRINDSWYCKEGNTYHAFYLMRPDRSKMQSCGHSVSHDLIHWDYKGVALEPGNDIWNNDGIATGSVAKYNGKWYMLYTARSKTPELYGLGLAVSDDLMTWQRVGDGPVIRAWDAAESYQDEGYPFEWEGKTVHCYPLADPYIYPEPIDGEYYIFVNSHAEGFPFNERGATAVFKTRDFTKFSPLKIASVGFCDRMETVQVWEHDGKFYMYVGRVKYDIDEAGHLCRQHNENWLFGSSSFLGPYKPVQELEFPREGLDKSDPPSYPYIAKVLNDPQGKEVMLINSIPAGVIGPYPMHYNGDGTIAPKYDI